MKDLYIDFDGVICNTIEITYKMIDDLKIDRKDNNQILKFYKNLDWFDVLEKATDINNGIERIKKIIDSGKFNVSILTHVNSVEEIEAKVKYIRKNFETIPVISVPKTIAKTQVLNAKNSILIDDYVGNLLDWRKAGGLGIRFDLDMDGKGFPVINELDEIIEVF